MENSQNKTINTSKEKTMVIGAMCLCVCVEIVCDLFK